MSVAASPSAESASDQYQLELVDPLLDDGYAVWPLPKALTTVGFNEGSFIPVYSIDYRCENDGRFPMTGSCLAISNSDSLSSIERGVNPGIRS
jgi:hypothetical protein